MYGYARSRPQHDVGIRRFYLEKNPGRQLLIEGHDDSRGSEEDNRELARRRAEPLAAALAQPATAARSIGSDLGKPLINRDTRMQRAESMDCPGPTR